jgi:predicted lipoprotein with Yx(FWY)xxD motif
MKAPSTQEHPVAPSRRRFAVVASSALALATCAGSIALATPPAMAQSVPKTTIAIKKNTAWGSILTLASGRTVYRFAKDTKNKSNCSGACAVVWPPVLLVKGQTAPVGKGVSHLGVIMRSNGAHQVTYEGVPLYLFIRDNKTSINGNIKDAFGQWWVINPATPTKTPVKVGSGGSSGPTTTAPSGGGAAY